MARSLDVDRWFAERDHPLTDAMQRARDIILDADGRVSESIKWSTPTFSYDGNIVSFMPAKAMVSLMFHRGAEIPGDHRRLEGTGKVVRTMRLKNLVEVESGAEDIRQAITAWCVWRDSL